MIYDEQKHTELKAERDRLETQLGEISAKMHDEYNSDEWGGENGPAKLIRYNADNQRHAQVTRELQLVAHQIERMEDVKPVDPKAVKGTMKDTLRRWMQKGETGLEQDERELFCTEPTSEMAAVVPDADRGSVFDPFALIKGSPLYDRITDPYTNIRMAVGDPSRGDISDESASGARDALGEARPETWAAGLVEALKYYGAVAETCHNFSTENGNDIHQNQLDTTDQEGGAFYDQSQTVDQGVMDPKEKNLGNVEDIIWKSYFRHSNFMGARLETFDDIHFDVAGRITRELGRRMGRGWNRSFTNGTGNNQPLGLVPSASVVSAGPGSIDAANKGIDYQNLLDMEYAIDLSYLVGNEGGDGGFRDAHGGMICYQANRNIEKQLRTMVYPTANLPIWVPNLERGAALQGAPGSLFGFPLKINQHMDDGTANNHKPLIFGAFGHFGVRNIGGPMYYRFWDSNTVKRMEVLFIAFSRRDSRCRGPWTSAKGCPAYVALQVKT